MLKNSISATQVIKDFNRRNIEPDYIHQVTQGFLRVWRINNNLIGEVLIGSQNGESVPGTLAIMGSYCYCNTTSPQDMSDDIINDSKIQKIDIELMGLSMTASQMGQKGGLSKSKAKVNAAKLNGKKGGRPKKTI